MVLCANACGKDIIEFVLEGKSENAFVNAPPKAEIKAQVFENQNNTTIVKAAKAKSKFDLQKAPFVQKYKCPFCNFTTHSTKSLSSHQKRHSSKYQSFDVAV
jgi:hypothetical protein